MRKNFKNQSSWCKTRTLQIGIRENGRKIDSHFSITDVLKSFDFFYRFGFVSEMNLWLEMKGFVSDGRISINLTNLVSLLNKKNLLV